MNDPVVVVSAARTPMGGFMGGLKSLAAPELGAIAIRATLERAGVHPGDVQEVIMGNVLPAGQGQAPARQAALGAGLPPATGCMTINKVCGSGMKAAMLAHDMLALGVNSVMVAGGMESMSNAPYLLPKARAGLRLGHGEVQDHMFLDGLEDAYDRGRLMGTFAPQRFRGAMTLFVATVSEAAPPVEMWRTHVSGEIRIHPVDCAHDNMMDPGPAETIGAIVAKALGDKPETDQTQRRKR